jgi:DnaJ-class molecular chaperone
MTNEQMIWVGCPHCLGTGAATDAHGEECNCGSCQGSAVVHVPVAIAEASTAARAA